MAGPLLERRLDPDGLGAFFDYVVYAWITGNGDLHAKDIAVLHHVRPGRLGAASTYEGIGYAPLYDLLNTRLVLRDDLFALAVNGKRNNLRRKDFAVLARRWGWTRSQSGDRIERIVAGIEEHLDAVLAASDLSAERQDAYRTIVRENLERL